jgi:hypothetical protein
MPNPTNETFEEEQQRNIKQGSQGNQDRQANPQQDVEQPREEEHIDDIEEDTEELSADDTDDADIAGGEEQIGDADDEESIERSADESADESANESAVRGDDLDEGNNMREAGQRTGDGRRQADDIDIERNDQRKDDEIEEE